MKKVIFNPDLSRHYQFREELDKILNLPDSSIAYCYLSSPYGKENFFLFFYSHKNKHDNSKKMTFNFNDFLLIDTDGDSLIQKYKKYGFSIKDLELLSDFLANYTFESKNEGLFFSSRFKELTDLKENYSRYCFKFTEDKKNKHQIIDNKKVIWFYALISKNTLYQIFKKIERDEKSLSKINIGFNFFCSIANYAERSEAIEAMIAFNNNQIDFNKGSVVIEYFEDFESNSKYTRTMEFQHGSETKIKNIRDFVNSDLFSKPYLKNTLETDLILK